MKVINADYISVDDCMDYLSKEKVLSFNKLSFKNRMINIIKKNISPENFQMIENNIYIRKDYINNSIELYKSSMDLVTASKEIYKVLDKNSTNVDKIRRLLPKKIKVYTIPLVSLDVNFVDKLKLEFILKEIEKLNSSGCITSEKLTKKINNIYRGIKFSRKDISDYTKISDLIIFRSDYIANFMGGQNLYPQSSVDKILHQLNEDIEKRVKLINISFEEYLSISEGDFKTKFISINNNDLNLIGEYENTTGRFRDYERTFSDTDVKVICINRGENFVSKKEYENFCEFKMNYVDSEYLKKFNSVLKPKVAKNNGIILKRYKGKYYINKNDLEKYLHVYRFNYEFSNANNIYDKVSIKIKYYPNDREKYFPEFKKYFMNFVKYKNKNSRTFIYVPRIYGIYNVLLNIMVKDLKPVNYEENNKLFEESINLVSASNDLRDMVIMFINYLRDKENFELKIMHDVREDKTKKTYSKEEFIHLLIKLIEIVADKNELKKLYRNWNLSSCITYLFMHYCIAWRKKDLLNQLPIPALTVIDGVTDGESFIRWLENGNEITDNMAHYICKSLEEVTTRLRLRASKNDEELNCVISDALSKEIALLLYINEANRQIHFLKYKKRRYKNRPFNAAYIEHKKMYILIKKFFNIDLEKILNGKFENVRMNKGFLELVKNKAEELGLAYSYYYSQVLRAHHKPSYKVFSETTKIYLNKDISKAAIMAFSTGTMGSVVNILLDLIDENFEMKEFEKKIMTIQNFNMIPYSIEINLKKISNKINMIKSEINNFLMNGGYKQGLLQELIYGNDNYGIEERTRCLLKITRNESEIIRIKSEEYKKSNITNKRCPFNRNTCIGCDYMIALRYFIYEFEKKFNCVLDDLEYAKTELDKEIAIESVNQLYLPVATDLALVLGDNIKEVININRYLRLADET